MKIQFLLVGNVVTGFAIGELKGFPIVKRHFSIHAYIINF